MFKYAVPITLKLKETPKKLSSFYAANFDCEGKDAILYVTCHKSCKITVNGEFAGFVECKIDGYKISGYKMDISKYISWGLNQIVFEVFSDDTNNAFFMAEVYADSMIKCATGKNFIGFIDTERLFDNYALINAGHYENYQKGGVCMLKADVKSMPNQYLVDIIDYKSNLKSKILTENTDIFQNNTLFFDLGKSDFAHFELAVFTKLDSKIRIETSQQKTFKAKNVFEFELKGGEYVLQNHTAHKFKYIKIFSEKGDILADYLKINSCAY